VLGYGTKDLRPMTSNGGFGSISEPKQADRILNAVLDAGINYIDTAIDYGPAEGYIGTFIGHRRNEYYLASKCGCLALGDDDLTETAADAHDFRSANIVAGVEQSLRRLKTDYLDLVQVHHAPSRAVIDRDAVIETLVGLQAAGKVRYFGSSSTFPEIGEHIALGAFDVLQMPYSALDRHYETLISEAAQTGAGTVIRGGIAQGQPGTGRGSVAKWRRFEQANLRELADGASDTEFLLRFTISHPDVSSTVVGTSFVEQLTENVTSAEKGPLADDVYSEAKARLDAIDLGAPPG
jgi:aryl-alcohol dehydrogenase-like predicted oxidoreductase